MTDLTGTYDAAATLAEQKGFLMTEEELISNILLIGTEQDKDDGLRAEVIYAVSNLMNERKKYEDALRRVQNLWTKFGYEIEKLSWIRNL